MLDSALTAIEQQLKRWLEALVSGRYWRVIATLAALLVALFFAFPDYRVLDSGFLNSYVWNSMWQKAQNPFFDIVTGYGGIVAFSAANENFRLVMPLIASPFGAAATPAVYLAIQAGFGVLLFYFSLRAAYRIIQDRVSALLMALAIATIYTGATAFVELRARFDGVAIAILLLSLLSENPLLIFLAVFAGGFTDERVLFASSLVLLFQWFANLGGKSDRELFRALIKPNTLAVPAAWIAYAAVRYWLTVAQGLSNFGGGNLGLSNFVNEFGNFPMASWTALEGLWLLVILACIVLIASKRWFSLLLFAGSILLVLGTGQAVVDKTRSMAYVLPAAFVALAILVRAASAVRLRSIVLISAIICVVAPTYYAGGESTIYWIFPLPLQLVRFVMRV